MDRSKIMRILLLVSCIAVVIGIIGGIGRRYVTYDKELGTWLVIGDTESGYIYAVYDDYVELVEYVGTEKDVIVPQELAGKPVTSIGKNCFAKSDITSVELSANVNNIAVFAFENCKSLETVTGNAELNVINAFAFENCVVLKKLEIGNSLKRIEAYAFYSCEELESIGEQPNLMYIGQNAFDNAGPLYGLQLNKNCEIDEAAFVASDWLKNREEEFVIVGDGRLIAYNGNEKTLHIPEGVKVLDQVFTFTENADAIEKIYLPDSVVELAGGAFSFCEEIRVYIPESVTIIEGESEGWTTRNSDTNALNYNNDTLTIVTTEGSTAQAYAEKYGIKCEIVEGW